MSGRRPGSRGKAGADDEERTSDAGGSPPRGAHLELEEITEDPQLGPPRRAAAGRLGGAFVADADTGENTSADPDPSAFGDVTARQPPSEALPVARPKKPVAPSPSAVQIDAVVGDRVPAIVVRRSAAELVDPASHVGRFGTMPASIELERMMGRAMGSPADPAAARARGAGDPVSNRSLPAQSDPVSNRSVGALRDPVSNRSLPAQSDPVSNRSVGALRDPVSNRSLPAQTSGGRPSGGGAAAQQPELAAREVTQINAAAALGIAPEPALPALPPRVPVPEAASSEWGAPPPLLRLELGGDRPAPPVPSSRPLGAPARAPDPAYVRSIAVPAAAFAGHARVPWTTTVAGLGAAVMVLVLVVTVARRERAPSVAPPTVAVDALAMAPVAVPPGAVGVRVLTRPAHAAIAVDGRALGRAPLLLRRPETARPRYQLEISAPGFRPWRGQLDLTTAQVGLEPQAGVAGASKLIVDDDGPSIVVALDRE